MPTFLSRPYEFAIPEGLMLGVAAYEEWGHADERRLSAAELAEFHRLAHVRRRCEFGLSRSLLRTLYGMMFPDETAPFVVLRDVGGKPYGLSHDRVIPLAVAHTRTHVFVAMSRAADIGLDAEPAARPEHPGLRRRILNAGEADDPALRDFATLQLWAAKESVLKLEGTGLRRSMRSVAVRRADSGLLETEIEGRLIGINSMRLQGHWVAISEYISASSDHLPKIYASHS